MTILAFRGKQAELERGDVIAMVSEGFANTVNFFRQVITEEGKGEWKSLMAHPYPTFLLPDSSTYSFFYSMANLIAITHGMRIEEEFDFISYPAFQFV